MSETLLGPPKKFGFRLQSKATLTPQGKKLAIELVRGMNWEYFLRYKLGYTKTEVHELADLEHATSTDLANRLAAISNILKGRRLYGFSKSNAGQSSCLVFTAGL